MSVGVEVGYGEGRNGGHSERVLEGVDDESLRCLVRIQSCHKVHRVLGVGGN